MEIGSIGASTHTKRENQGIATVSATADHNNICGSQRANTTIMTVDTESLSTRFREIHNDETSGGQSSRESPPPTSVANTTNNNNQHQLKQISQFDAIQHLIKGNLGPGCLNIPHAFATCGYVLGLFLFALVAIQGIYSMVLLVYCKQWIRAAQQERRRLTTTTTNNYNTSNNNTTEPSQHDAATASDEIVTFMDVAYATYGRPGAACVQILLFVLQAGVCCVFLSLIATNLHASIPSWDSDFCVCLVTLMILFVVLVRDLKELKWLSLGANCLMVTAIGTASLSAIWVLVKDGHDNDNDAEQQVAKKWTGNPAAIAAFVSSMFYSFEGIGLVMPVENSFVGYKNNNSSSASHELPVAVVSSEEKKEEELRIVERTKTFVSPVLIGAMATVAGLFLLIGATCGPAFPDIVDGSVTAYLTTKYPSSLWYQIVNASVMVAVFLTFPLQLTPAMEVLGDWFGPGCDPVCCSGSYLSSGRSCCFGGGGLSRRGGRHAIVAQSDENDANRLEGFQDEGESPAAVVLSSNDETTVTASPPPPLPNNSCFGGREWIFRRYLVVFGCAIVVLTVNDLGLLMALFGSLGNTGLAAMPCIIHWRLVQQGIAPLNFLLLAIDIATIVVSLGVAVIGVAFSVKEILED